MVAEATMGAVEGSQPSGAAAKGSRATSSGPAASGAGGPQETHAQVWPRLALGVRLAALCDTHQQETEVGGWGSDTCSDMVKALRLGLSRLEAMTTSLAPAAGCGEPLLRNDTYLLWACARL